MPTPTKYTYSIASDFPGGAVNTTNLGHSFYGSRWDHAKNEYNKSGSFILANTRLVGRTMFYWKYAILAHPY